MTNLEKFINIENYRACLSLLMDLYAEAHPGAMYATVTVQELSAWAHRRAASLWEEMEAQDAAAPEASRG